jgi:hypothetical protein
MRFGITHLSYNDFFNRLMNSANFAFWAFSEVRLNAVLKKFVYRLEKGFEKAPRPPQNSSAIHRAVL